MRFLSSAQQITHRNDIFNKLKFFKVGPLNRNSTDLWAKNQQEIDFWAQKSV